MAIKFLKNFAPPEPLTKFQIKKLMHNLSIFNLAAFYIFHFFYKNFSKKQTAMEFFNNCSRNSDRNFAHKSSRRYLFKPIFFCLQVFPRILRWVIQKEVNLQEWKFTPPNFLDKAEYQPEKKLKSISEDCDFSTKGNEILRKERQKPGHVTSFSQKWAIWAVQAVLRNFVNKLKLLLRIVISYFHRQNKCKITVSVHGKGQ